MIVMAKDLGGGWTLDEETPKGKDLGGGWTLDESPSVMITAMPQPTPSVMITPKGAGATGPLPVVGKTGMSGPAGYTRPESKPIVFNGLSGSALPPVQSVMITHKQGPPRPAPVPQQILPPQAGPVSEIQTSVAQQQNPSPALPEGWRFSPEASVAETPRPDSRVQNALPKLDTPHPVSDFTQPVKGVPVVADWRLQTAMPAVFGSKDAPPEHGLQVVHAQVSPSLPIGPPSSAQVKVTVSLPDKKVVVQDGSGKVLRTFPVYIGTSANPTPTGQFKIIDNVQPGPSEWYYGGHFLSFNKETDKANPQQTNNYGFHGWVYDKEDDKEERSSPGWKTSTHGCVQLSNKDVADFANLVRAGDPVTILNSSLEGRR